MRTGKGGIDLIKRFEGLALEAYQDIAGIWTIGYGHTSDGLSRHMNNEAFAFGWLNDFIEVERNNRLEVERVTITEENAEKLLARNLWSRERALNDWMDDKGVTLNRNEFDALISFIYNVGFSAFRGSTAARWLIAGKPREKVAEALTWWNKARVNGKLREVKGLTRRRAEERALFLTPVGQHIPEPIGFFERPIDHRTSNVCPAKEQRPLRTYFPNFMQECRP